MARISTPEWDNKLNGVTEKELSYLRNGKGEAIGSEVTVYGLLLTAMKCTHS